MKKVLFFCVLLSGAMASSQQTPQKFVLETQYLLYLPDGYEADGTKNWPLMIFLHGSGESGEDVNKVAVNGPPRLIAQGKKFPMIVVSPQAPKPEGFKPDIIKKMLDDLKKKYRVDPDRVYLTGLSMGGYGTWEIAQKFPEEFAAIAPVCGGGNPESNYRLAHIPIWCFHGAKDDVVLPSESEEMIKSVKQYNDNVQFTLYPETNHNSWDNAYSTEELYTWMLGQKRYRYKEIPVEKSRLDQLSGKFVNKTDTLTIEKRGDSLVIYNGSQSTDAIRFRQYEKQKFYLFLDRNDEFHYVFDKRANVVWIEYWGDDRRRQFKKLKPNGFKR